MKSSFEQHTVKKQAAAFKLIRPGKKKQNKTPKQTKKPLEECCWTAAADFVWETINYTHISKEICSWMRLYHCMKGWLPWPASLLPVAWYIHLHSPAVTKGLILWTPLPYGSPSHTHSLAAWHQGAITQAWEAISSYGATMYTYTPCSQMLNKALHRGLPFKN